MLVYVLKPWRRKFKIRQLFIDVHEYQNIKLTKDWSFNPFHIKSKLQETSVIIDYKENDSK